MLYGQNSNGNIAEQQGGFTWGGVNGGYVGNIIYLKNVTSSYEATKPYFGYGSSTSPIIKKTSNTVYFYNNESPQAQFNRANTTYHYLYIYF